MTRKLIVAAVSARPYVALAATAAFDVIALDIFADVDTQALAQQVLRLPYQDGGFEPKAFAAALVSLAAEDIMGMVYGSGFESRLGLLQIAAQQLAVNTQHGLIGNSVDSVRRAKDGLVFFDLLRHYNILHPETRIQAPDQSQGWLRKRMGGSGGTQVHRAFQDCPPDTKTHKPSEFVYQRELSGTPVSLLFLANAQRAEVIGFNQQFCQPGQGMPFRYGGLVSHADLPASAKLALQTAAAQLTQALSLKGLNSLDAILAQDGKVYVLEINPRLTASAGLYATDIPLMELHLRASLDGELPAFQVQPEAKALAVCYAKDGMEIGDGAWPEWVADIPPAGTVIAEDEPCCTVQAQAVHAADAWALAQARVTAVLKQ